MKTFDRQDGVLEYTRFRLDGGRITAQQLEKRLVVNDVREFRNGPERVAGKILPLSFGVAAHVWQGNGLVKLGEFDSEQEALEAICERFSFADCRRMLQAG